MAIETQEIEGREAYVVYMKSGEDDLLVPCEKDDAELIKVKFKDNGETAWLSAEPAESDKEEKK